MDWDSRLPKVWEGQQPRRKPSLLPNALFSCRNDVLRLGKPPVNKKSLFVIYDLTDTVFVETSQL